MAEFLQEEVFGSHFLYTKGARAVFNPVGGPTIKKLVEATARLTGGFGTDLLLADA
jgi:hypothetical protein